VRIFEKTRLGSDEPYEFKCNYTVNLSTSYLIQLLKETRMYDNWNLGLVENYTFQTVSENADIIRLVIIFLIFRE
jgi:hypothetical protein